MNDECGDDFVPENLKTNSLKLNLSAEIADRYHLSDRAFGAIASGVLADAGFIQSSNTNLIVDKNKARRSRLKKRKYEEDQLVFDGIALIFDGRKDETLKIGKSNDGNYYCVN